MGVPPPTCPPPHRQATSWAHHLLPTLHLRHTASHLPATPGTPPATFLPPAHCLPNSPLPNPPTSLIHCLLHAGAIWGSLSVPLQTSCWGLPDACWGPLPSLPGAALHTLIPRQANILWGQQALCHALCPHTPRAPSLSLSRA